MVEAAIEPLHRAHHRVVLFARARVPAYRSAAVPSIAVGDERGAWGYEKQTGPAECRARLSLTSVR